MNSNDLLTVVNAFSAALDGLAAFNVPHQRIIDMKAAKNGEPFTKDDLTELYQENKSTLNTLIGDE